MAVKAYMRASTSEQDAHRAEDNLKAFAIANGLQIDAWYVEHISGTKLDRPELSKLISQANNGDILLVESVDRLSRLHESDYTKLKHTIESKGLHLVVADLPTTYIHLKPNGDDLTSRIMKAVNNMVIDIVAAQARDWWEKTRSRQQQGIEKAQAEGKYRGRQANANLHSTILALHESGKSKRDIAELAGCSRQTVHTVIRNSRG